MRSYATEPHYRRGSRATRPPAGLGGDPLEGSCCARLGIILECAVAVNQLPAGGCDSRAVTTTGSRNEVLRLDSNCQARRQHAKISGWLRGGASAGNGLEERDLARTHAAKCCKVQPKSDSRISHRSCFLLSC